MMALLGTLTALLALAQTLLIPAALSSIVSGTASLIDVWPFIVGIVAMFACRTLIVAAREVVSIRAVAATVRELRERVMDMIVTLRSRWRATKGTETTTLLSTGLEDLRPYFVSLLPRLTPAYTVTLAALGVILLLGFWSVLIALLVIPPIPIFIILIGCFTQAISEDKPASMRRLTAQLLDLMSGLPVLRGLDREKVPRTHLHVLDAANTGATIATLRVVFLSGGMLEFLMTLSMTLVAIEVDIRSVFGDILLFRGLAVIMLAPKVFDPLRQVGVQSRVSASGVTVSKATFGIIEEAEAVSSPGTDECPDVACTDIALGGLGTCARDAWTPAPTSGVITLGIMTTLYGPSGVGKSMIVLYLLADMTPDAGCVLPRPSAPSSESSESVLLDIDPVVWRHQISWVPQSPMLVPDTILGSMGDLPLGDLSDTTAVTGFDDVLASAPDG